MTGKECVAIGSDLRLGVQFQTLATDFQKIYKIHDKLFLGLAGLGTDALTLANLFKFRCGVASATAPGHAGGRPRRGLCPCVPQFCDASYAPRAFRHNLYKLREERNMSPQAFASMVSNALYQKRFGPYFCEPGDVAA